MLTNEKKSILKLMIALAWADGQVDKEETEIVEAMFDAFSAEKQEAEEIRKWSLEPKTLDDIDISNLEKSDLALALQYGVLLSFIDGEQSEKEIKLIDELIAKLGFSKEEAQPIKNAAVAFAKQLLPELEN